MARARRERATAAAVPFREALWVWARVAALSFGGPAGQIAVMHRILVEEKRWISERRFLHALNFCMLLPGPEAQQLATYVGWLLHRTLGGLVAGSLFVLPGFVSILLLSIVYVTWGSTAFVAGLFLGLKAAVLALVVEAVIRIGKRALANRAMVALAAAAFAAIFLYQVPFPAIVLAAGVIGLVGGRLAPEVFHVLRAPGVESEVESNVVIDDFTGAHTKPTLRRAAVVTAIGALLWLGPLAALAAWLGRGHVLVAEGLFFSKAAVVTFGGAYSVLAYIAQQAVEVHGWLRPGEMLDGLGMAETTPGPLIQVVQFVGFLGAYRNPAPFGPLGAALLGSVVATWATFAPCFLWIFLGAPYVERLRGNAQLSSALSAITAAVVGVVLNLALWFGLHVSFAVLDEVPFAGMRLLVPEVASIQVFSVIITAAAFFVLFRLHWGIVRTLLLSSAAGLVYQLLLRPWLGG